MIRSVRGALTLALLVAAACAASSTNHSPKNSDVIANSVDTLRVDGRLVHIHLLGTSGPSVVLVSGFGDGLRPWSEVQPAVAQFARVLSYDRLGLGQSEPGPTPRTVSRMTNELHALLARTGLPKPYVLVGHSMGGFIAQFYAARYSREVGGLVLVDPSIAGFYVHAQSLPEWAQAMDEQKRKIALAPPGIRAEGESMNEDLAEMLGAPAIPKLPIVLLTSIHHGPPSPQPSPLDSIWLAEHQLWAHEHPGTRQVVDTIHGHYLQREVPAVVVDAIRSVIAEGRAHR